MSRELPTRAWEAGAGPGDGPLTIDLDSTICETSRLTRVFQTAPAAGLRGRPVSCCLPSDMGTSW